MLSEFYLHLKPKGGKESSAQINVYLKRLGGAQGMFPSTIFLGIMPDGHQRSVQETKPEERESCLGQLVNTAGQIKGGRKSSLILYLEEE